MSSDPTVQDHLGDLFQKTGRLKLARSLGRAVEEWNKTVPAEVETDLLVATQKKLDAAKVRLAKEDPRTSKQYEYLVPSTEQDDSFSVPGTRNSVLLPVKLPACWPATPCKWNFPADAASLKPPHPYRNDYQRDRDRVIHARAFRRWSIKRKFSRAAIPTTSATGSRTPLKSRRSRAPSRPPSLLTSISPKRWPGARSRPSSLRPCRRKGTRLCHART